MLNKFCFHLYAQKSLFIGENCNVFFLTAAPYPLTLEFLELVPSFCLTFRIFFNYVFQNATVCLHVITYQKQIIIVHEKVRIPRI